jgi:hypothetical protein
MNDENNDQPMLQDDETGFKQDLKREAAEPKLVDAGIVVMMMAVEGKGMIAVPVTSVFQQLFSIINHLDSRVAALESGKKDESQIITLN